MASDYSAARQEFVDRINAGVALGVPFIQKRVNLGKKVITEDARSNGIITVFVPAGGTGDVEDLTDGNGPKAGALDRTADAAAGKGSSSFYKMECYAQNAWEYIEHNALEKIFQIGEIKPNIIQPRVNHLVQNIEKMLVTKSWTRAGGACVAGSTEHGFVAMDKAMATLQTVKSEGSWTGFVSPMLRSKLGTDAAKKNGGFDVPDDTLKEIYGKKSIGVFAGIDWVNEAFMPNYKAGALNASSTGVKVSAEVKTQGASTITLSGLPSSGTITKGTPFTIDGVYEVTTAGIALMDMLKVFIVQKDVTISSGAATVEVLPMYFADNTKGYQNNIGAEKIAANATVNGLCEAGATYHIAYVKEDEALNWTPFALPDVENCTNTTSETEDVSVQLVSGGSLLTRKNSMRMDSAFFGDIVDPRACRLVYVKA